MWIETFDSPGKMEITTTKKDKWNPPLISIRCLGMGHLTIKSATKLRDKLDKFIKKHK